MFRDTRKFLSPAEQIDRVIDGVVNRCMEPKGFAIMAAICLTSTIVGMWAIHKLNDYLEEEASQDAFRP